MRAPVASGKPADAIEYAEASRTWFDPNEIARACEEILHSMGRSDEAYERYALIANERSTFLATFRAVAKKYPGVPRPQLLMDLVRSTPGKEGKWFAAAKEAGLRAEALELARRSPCDPRTLTRAARDFAITDPAFAMEAGILALIGIADGHGYEIDSSDVLGAFTEVRRAAEEAGRTEEARKRLHDIGTSGKFASEFVGRHLAPSLKAWERELEGTR